MSDGKGFEKPGAHPKECHKEAVAEEASPSGNPCSKENLGFTVSVFNKLVISLPPPPALPPLPHSGLSLIPSPFFSFSSSSL